MKTILFFKTPDILETIDKELGASEEEIDNMKEFCSKYIRHSEYLTVEFDDKNETVTVLKK